MRSFAVLLTLVPFVLLAQSRKQRKAMEAQHKAEQHIINNLEAHVGNLAGKSRDAVVDYVTGQFAALGLEAKGTHGFTQPYKEANQRIIGANTYLRVNGSLLELNKDFFPLAWSAEKKVTGAPVMALRERGVPWFFDLKYQFSPKGKTQAMSTDAIIRQEAGRAASRGATALLVFNSSATADPISFNKHDSSQPALIPVLYITSAAFHKYFPDNSAALDIELNVSLKTVAIEGTNIVGFKNNKATSNALIASSLPLSVMSEGNAVQMSAFIEAVKYLSAKSTSTNYLFAVFDEEKETSFGAERWLADSTNSTKVKYAFFIDSSQEKTGGMLAIQGLNTSALWMETISSIMKNNEAHVDSVSSLQHAPLSFVKRKIPALVFTSNATMAGQNHERDFKPVLQAIKLIYDLAEATGKTNVVWIK